MNESKKNIGFILAVAAGAVIGALVCEMRDRIRLIAIEDEDDCCYDCEGCDGCDRYVDRD